MIISKYYGNYCCEDCGSFDTIQESNGFVVCKICGIEQSLKNISKEFPFKKNDSMEIHATQYYFKGMHTKIGYPIEINTERSFRLDNTQKKYLKDYVFEKMFEAQMEMSRIFAQLHLDIVHKHECLEFYKDVFNQIPRYKKERASNNLVPIIIYHYTRILGIVIHINELFKVMNCSKDKFKSCFNNTYHLFIKEDKNFRSNQLKQLIDQCCDDLNLSFEYKNKACKFIIKYKGKISNTIPRVAAGTCIGLAVIYLDVDNKIRLSSITKSLDITPAAITTRIKKILKLRGYNGSIPNLRKRIYFKNRK